MMSVIETALQGFADPARDSAHAFRAAVDVMARPGVIKEMPAVEPPAPLSSAAAALVLVLCDKTTGLYLGPRQDVPEVRSWITFTTGAPVVAPEIADFVLGDWAELSPPAQFKVGTPEYPDRSATLIVERDALSQSGAVLRGPGIKDTARFDLPDLAAFQANRAQFPLGFDVFFSAGRQVAAVPRSTRVSEG